MSPRSPHRIRIGLVTESFAPRGDEVADTARHLVDEFLVSGHEVLVLTTGVGAASYRGARVVRSRRALPDSALGSCLQSWQPDRVIAVSPRVLGNQSLRVAARSQVATVAIDAKAPRARADVFLSTCSSGTDPVWLPGVDLEENHPRLRDDRLHDMWSKGRPLVVGHVGEIRKEKVLARLERLATLPDIRLVVLAAGEAGARLRAAGAKVTSPMNSLDLARAVASLDVLVQARKRDRAVPGVRRALASGVPVVAYDAGGAADVVKHGVNGLLVDPRSQDSLGDAISRLVGDPALRDGLASEARRSVTGRTWGDAADDLLSRGRVPHAA